jgi:hypothetical protein
MPKLWISRGFLEFLFPPETEEVSPLRGPLPYPPFQLGRRIWLRFFVPNPGSKLPPFLQPTNITEPIPQPTHMKPDDGEVACCSETSVSAYKGNTTLSRIHFQLFLGLIIRFLSLLSLSLVLSLRLSPLVPLCTYFVIFLFLRTCDAKCSSIQSQGSAQSALKHPLILRR